MVVVVVARRRSRWSRSRSPFFSCRRSRPVPCPSLPFSSRVPNPARSGPAPSCKPPCLQWAVQNGANRDAGFRPALPRPGSSSTEQLAQRNLRNTQAAAPAGQSWFRDVRRQFRDAGRRRGRRPQRRRPCLVLQQEKVGRRRRSVGQADAQQAQPGECGGCPFCRPPLLGHAGCGGTCRCGVCHHGLVLVVVVGAALPARHHSIKRLPTALLHCSSAEYNKRTRSLFVFFSHFILLIACNSCRFLVLDGPMLTTLSTSPLPGMWPPSSLMSSFHHHHE